MNGNPELRRVGRCCRCDRLILECDDYHSDCGEVTCRSCKEAA